jgi:hypothetical protein
MFWISYLQHYFIEHIILSSLIAGKRRTAFLVGHHHYILCQFLSSSLTGTVVLRQIRFDETLTQLARCRSYQNAVRCDPVCNLKPRFSSTKLVGTAYFAPPASPTFLGGVHLQPSECAPAGMQACQIAITLKTSG